MVIGKRLQTMVIVVLFILFSNVFCINAREIININEGWLYKKGEYIDAKNIDFNDDSWETIQVPHNWGWDEAQNGNKKYYRGSGWYRKKIAISIEEGKRYFVRFEAVSSMADVYLNGKLLGKHRGAFSAFCYELTEHLNNNGNNILAVRASNEKADDIAPLGGDFNIYGGIYRSVSIIETSDVCFSLTDYASPGVTWLQKEVSKEKAVLDIETWISNGTKNGLKFTHFPKELGQVLPEGLFTLKAKVINDKGIVVAKKEKHINVHPNNTIPYFMQLEINEPRLWHGTIDPYLYNAVIELYKGKVMVDVVMQPLGLRYFHIDPDKGFFLNGESYRLRGVSKHQDRKDKGWAVTNADLDEDMHLITEMGANAIRCAHYQHSDYWMDLCDKEGMLVWAEIAQVGSIRNTPEFVETSRSQWLELIRQNINHPSIFSWGMFNEVHVRKKDPHRQFVDLKKLAYAEDPTRPTVAATSHAMSPDMNQITDILGWNRYPGWYDPYADLKNDTLWNKYKVTSKNGGFSFSEYGAGANIEHHEQNPEQPIPADFWHPEEWQSKVHEAAWESYSQRPFIWGSFIWNMFDFCAAKRREGGKKGINDKGIVTFDRKEKKDAYFFYKANWNATPMLYLTSKRHKIRNKELTPIKVYCNIGTEVTLRVNGKKISEKLPNNYSIVVWEDIKLRKGKNRIKVSVQDKGTVFMDEVIWIYDSEAKGLKQVNEKSKRIGGDGGFGQ